LSAIVTPFQFSLAVKDSFSPFEAATPFMVREPYGERYC